MRPRRFLDLNRRVGLVSILLAGGCAHPSAIAPSSTAVFEERWGAPSAVVDTRSFDDVAVDGGDFLAATTAPATAPAGTTRGRAAVPPPPPGVPSPPPQVATDAPVRRSLIVYTARFVLALYEVEATARALADAAGEAGGFVSSWQGNQLTVRIPAAEFPAFLARVEGAGRVIDRNLQASDVSEQFRDLEIRLQNLIAVRARLEGLLASAGTVEQALQVERELERVTLEIESIRGRLRVLTDQVAYSTLTVVFQALPREQLSTPDAPTPVGIPWLRTLGLGQLLGAR